MSDHHQSSTSPRAGEGEVDDTDLLRLGPLVRYVDEDCAVVWVETEAAGEVTVVAGGDRTSARTFGVHGHHFALVEVTGLRDPTSEDEEGPTDKDGDRHASHLEYTVEVNGQHAWPPRDSAYPPPVLAALRRDKPLRLAFGSCRTSVSHDAEGNDTHGVDALRAYALRMAGVTDGGDEDPDARDGKGGGVLPWPDLVLFLGDQVYADETTAAMREFISSRRDIEQEPGTELADFEEYAHLYRLAWSDPANRWLLSTLPSLMIFDDHDIRDDWNTSQAWKKQMEATSWWHGRIVGGLASYWVYQHLGNLNPQERAEDEVWQLVLKHEGDDEVDLSEVLDAFADRADQDPGCHRWSYVREFGHQARLVVVDSRAARVLEPEKRTLLDEAEMEWLQQQLRGDVDHLLIGTSLPFLLAPGLHYVEAFNESLSAGAWGERGARAGETFRQGADLEHWAAFQEAFGAVSRGVLETASGSRGEPPKTVTFLSGDVHHSYVSEAYDRTGEYTQRSRIVQAVCSPIRNPLARRWRFATAILSYGVAGPLGRTMARSSKVPDAPLKWGLLRGPWFDNNLATLEVHKEGLRMWWATGVVHDGDHDRPTLKRVADVMIEDRAPQAPGGARGRVVWARTRARVKSLAGGHRDGA